MNMGEVCSNERYNQETQAYTVSDAITKAKNFLSEEQAFRLGELPTESSHPKTRALSDTTKADLPAGIRLLQSVDEEICPVADKNLRQGTFSELVDAFALALNAGKRIFFTGCGATGRLSILLEAAWRRFWQGLERKNLGVSEKMSGLEDSVISVMAGGDFALIKAVEGFEDFPYLGRYQLKRVGMGPNDVVVAITEGGETPFVIGTAWQGLDSGARVFFVYNNPTEILRSNVQRSREIIEEPRIRKLDLFTGPMAITGSTRMQAVTIELLIVGGALEMALVQLLQEHLSEAEWMQLGLCARSAGEYHQLFSNLLAQLSGPAAVDSIARAVEFEEGIYRQRGLITYMADSILLDVLTDTTERSPTFMVPPFRKDGDSRSPLSWAFVKNPYHCTQDAWWEMLRREPRGLEWGPAIYEQLSAPRELQLKPPKLGNAEVYRFRIGNEPAPARADAPESALVAITIADEAEDLLRVSLEKFASQYKKTAAMVIGSSGIASSTGELFSFDCELPGSPLQLWRHLAVKLILNTLSTATMVRMGRVVGNAMVWLSPSNKKLIDRGSRLISQQTGCSYEEACIALHQAIEDVEMRSGQVRPASGGRGEEVPSPVALAIERINNKGQRA